MSRIRKWLPDFFGRRKLVAKHDEILEEVKTTSEMARSFVERRSFPISRTVGNPRLRRDV